MSDHDPTTLDGERACRALIDLSAELVQQSGDYNAVADEKRAAVIRHDLKLHSRTILENATTALEALRRHGSPNGTEAPHADHAA